MKINAKDCKITQYKIELEDNDNMGDRVVSLSVRIDHDNNTMIATFEAPSHSGGPYSVTREPIALDSRNLVEFLATVTKEELLEMVAKKNVFDAGLSKGSLISNINHEDYGKPANFDLKCTAICEILDINGTGKDMFLLRAKKILADSGYDAEKVESKIEKCVFLDYPRNAKIFAEAFLIHLQPYLLSETLRKYSEDLAKALYPCDICLSDRDDCEGCEAMDVWARKNKFLVEAAERSNKGGCK